jgi:D-lactate dehydrogenase (cytochrome)
MGTCVGILPYQNASTSSCLVGAGVQEQAEAVAAITQDHEGSAFKYASAPEEREKLWAARHSAYWAACALRPGCRGFPTDVCVPISRYG